MSFGEWQAKILRIKGNRVSTLKDLSVPLESTTIICTDNALLCPVSDFFFPVINHVKPRKLYNVLLGWMKGVAATDSSNMTVC